MSDEIARAFDFIGGSRDARLNAESVQQHYEHLHVSVTMDEARTAVRGLQSDDDETVNLTKFLCWWNSTSHAFARRKLTSVINKCQEHVKYLPGVTLGHHLTAMPDLSEAVADATLLIFVTPHQFIKGLCGQIRPSLSPGAKAISHHWHGRDARRL